MSDYQRLGALDRVFLDMEDGNAHMHIGAVMIFEPAFDAKPGEGVDIERVRRFIAGRLNRVPRYRQRIARIPLEDHPVWVDDCRFDLNYHIRHISVPHPGDERQLKRLVAWINSQPLDRSRPLWEMWVIEGLENDRFAIFQKVHHCMVDGIGGAEEMAVLLSTDPDEPVEIPRRWQPRPTPTALRLVTDAALRRASTPIVAGRSVLRRLRSDPRDTLGLWRQTARGVASILTRAVPPAADTRINGSIGAQRRFDWLQSDLGLIKRIKDELGGTVNDVVLATVTGALRRYFLQHGVAPDELGEQVIRAMCPVDRRREDGSGGGGNKIAGMFVELPVGVSDARLRLALVGSETVEAKRAHQADVIEAVAGVSEWTTPALLHAIGRTGSRGRTYNLVVTNVPGPQQPLYLLGAPLSAAIPVVPIFEHQGLTVALFSYAGKMLWGFNADRDLVPDLHELTLAVEQSLVELAAAAGIELESVEPERRRAESEARLEAEPEVSESYFGGAGHYVMLAEYVDVSDWVAAHGSGH